MRKDVLAGSLPDEYFGGKKDMNTIRILNQ
jgi:hypothetical protein